MARKKAHEEHENHERWLVSYADFITLLFAFFVVMYSISSVNEGKYRVLSDALVSAFRSSPKSLQPIQIGSLSKAPVISTAQEDHRKPAMMRLPKMYISQSETLEGLIRDPLMNEQFTEGGDLVNIGKIADAVEKALESLVDQGVITITRNALWIEVEIRDSILFPSGSARLQEGAIPVLEELARILLDFPNPVRVEGYTDNVPINTIVYPSNWELSAARAASVIRLFAGAGIPPQRMVAQGYGEYRPLADNKTPEGRAKNRRVVIVVLADKEVERLLGDRATAAQRRFLLPAEGQAEPPGMVTEAAVPHPEIPQPLAATGHDTEPATPEGTAVGSVGPAGGRIAAGREIPGEFPLPPPPMAPAASEAGGVSGLQPVQWRSAAAQAASLPVPAPPAKRLLVPPPTIAGALITPPISLGAPIAPLAKPAPRAGEQQGQVGHAAEPPSAPPPAEDGTISDITHYR